LDIIVKTGIGSHTNCLTFLYNSDRREKVFICSQQVCFAIFKSVAGRSRTSYFCCKSKKHLTIQTNLLFFGDKEVRWAIRLIVWS